MDAHNQRLEFLGDAVLSLILAEALFTLFPNEREGNLARARSALAKGEYLALLARKLGLPKHLRLATHERQAGGHERPSSQEDALEALIGAIYLDSDFETARGIVLGWYGDLAHVLRDMLNAENPKGRLQEFLMAQETPPSHEYRTTEISGPEHRRQFKVECLVAGQPAGEGAGFSKKEAEEAAARAALLKLQNSAPDISRPTTAP